MGNYTSHLVLEKSIWIYENSSSLRFIFYRPDILRVDYLPNPGTVFDSSFVIIKDTSEIILFSVIETDSSIEISSSELRVVVNKFPIRLSFYNSTGKLLLEEPDDGGISFNNNERKVNFILQQEDNFYGTGERGTSLNKRGQAFDSYNTQVYGYSNPLPTMNINVPFVASTRGYALYFENTYPGHFDLGNTNPAQFNYNVSGGELSYFFIEGEKIPEQLKKYTWFTGNQPLPPKWAFGFIQSKFGYQNENEARNIVQTMRLKEIPCDAIVLDLYWFQHMGDITWNFVNWPNPFQMMSDFFDEGIKTIVITEPYIIEYSNNFPAASSNNYLATNSQGNPYLIGGWWSCGCNAGLLDITNPSARNWWWNLHPSFFGNELAGIWTDLGEPENHPADMNHFLGSRDKIHNIYNLLWSETIFNGYNQLRPNQRLFNLTRSGYAGSQRYSVSTWSGDVAKSFGGLKVQPSIVLNMGMSGFGYQNSDIGGFCCGFTTPELYVRWMQFGTFSPITRAHGSNQPTEPWNFGAEAEMINKNFIQLRYQLIPYIYSMAYENYKTGMPLVRPLFFDYTSNNLDLFNLSDTYLFGKNILVSPVMNENQTSKLVYLPEGKWIDFRDDKIYDGGSFYFFQMPLSSMPVFIKAGSVIPMQPVMNYTDEFPADTIIIKSYPVENNSSSFILYEDDGKTLDYQSGFFAETIFSQNISNTEAASNIELTIGETIGTYTGKPASRIYLAEFHRVFSNPSLVMMNDITLSQRNSYEELRENEYGFYFDQSLKRLYVQIKTVPDSEYVINVNNVVLNMNGEQTQILKEFVLEQNYPNPFNSTTVIKYKLPKASDVKLEIYNITGEKITTLVSEFQYEGEHTVQINANDLQSELSSGVYFYKLSADEYIFVKKLIYLK
ncbi:MAG: hypothetical protein A2V93_12440 [Ignavibacteria bacterium RBG_16_34_14]|nr:MAG: hypothetical protein A2V93_12440 [Ignavibacteria bacterium RBG_16_34_14]